MREAVGAALDFLHDGLEIVADTRIEMTDAFIGYVTWCKAKALRSMAVADVDDMEELCKQFSIRSVIDGERNYLMDVRLAASTPRSASDRWRARRRAEQ
jgi:hypothetical protein